MSRACAVRISAHHQVLIVNSKQDCRNGARRIDREVQRPIGVPVVAVKDSCGVYIVSHHQLFVIIDLVSKGRESSRDAKRRYGSATVDERLEDPAAVGSNPPVRSPGSFIQSRLVWTAPGTSYSVKVPPDSKNE